MSPQPFTRLEFMNATKLRQNVPCHTYIEDGNSQAIKEKRRTERAKCALQKLKLVAGQLSIYR